MRIPVAQNQAQLSPLPSVQRSFVPDTRGQSISNALGNVSDVASKIQIDERNKADRAAFMEADVATDNISNSLYQQATSRKLKDAIGSGPEVMTEFDKQSAEVMKGLKSPRQQMAYKAALNQSRSNLQRQVDSHERQQTEQYYETERRSYAEQAHTNAVTYYNDPKRIEQEIAKQSDVIRQTPGISEEMKATNTARIRSITYADVIDRYLANEQVAGAEAYYKSVKGKVGGEAATHIENSIRVTKDRIENRAIALSNKREAAALRVLNQANEQIASTVPATPEMWKTWSAAVKGTSVEGEFSSMQKDEADVQDMLRRPIGEQVKFVQDKEAALKSGGGSVRELRNFNRLRTAVQQNVKLLGESPLQFNAVRTGAEVVPLDIAGMANSDPAAQAQIIDRVNTLTGMQKQYGVVPMKVLLPQEVAQLSSVLGRATPKQQSELFSGMYNTMGTEAYKVAMQQIAPDSPVRAIAGMIAGKQAQMTTKTHWFKPDEIIGSGDVSATMLQGEDILNASKTDKKTEGKPKLSLYLPETNTLQADFQNQVGDAFAGRPAAADVAFQAVKAYYVGRAAQIGRLASDNKDIDSRLVREAIAASLGTVVNYNGSDVFAPWGMDKPQFLDKVHASLLAKGKESGLNEKQLEQFAGASLKNAGDSSYYVTQGKNFVTDAAGKPIVIKIE